MEVCPSRNNKYNKLPDSGYIGNGYDHGHMDPCRDFKWDSRAWFESFYMTNMAPQKSGMKPKAWQGSEDQCRKWVRIYPGNL